jgi:putative oxygen-independent coproporphyrinogen III oxidase
MALLQHELPPSAPASPIGVYVHFPFCLAKCPYCDFVSYAAAPTSIEHARYADAVIAELELRAGALEGRRLESLFFGGGTPSLWEPSELGRVLRAVLEAAGERGEIEITVECNPTSLDEERARALVDVGVNRVSLGIQGLDEGRLRFLGRLHDPAGGLAAIEAALAARVPRVSADLIFGVGGSVANVGDPAIPAEQRAEAAASEARRVAETGVTHISAYGLTIEPGTQFGERARRGRLPLASDDVVSDSFFAIEDALAAQGFAHYEVSNYAVPGDEARHNLGYWRGYDYLGLGCAAYGTIAHPTKPGHAVRYRNVVDPKRYVAAAESRSLDAVTESGEPLDPEARLRERIMLGLRMREGFDIEAAARALDVDARPASRARAAARLEAGGRIERSGDRLRVPSAAWIFADGIAADLF